MAWFKWTNQSWSWSQILHLARPPLARVLPLKHTCVKWNLLGLWNCWSYCDSALFLLRRERVMERKGNLVLMWALYELNFIACTLPTGIRFVLVLFTSNEMTCPFNWKLKTLGMPLVETLELPQFSHSWIFTCRVIVEEWKKLFNFDFVLLYARPKYNFYLRLPSRKVTRKTDL